MVDTYQAFNLRDENGSGYGVKHINNKPRVSAMPYTYDIAEGNVSGHEAWTKIGFTPAMTTTKSDVWSYGGVYTFPAIATNLSIWSSSANDNVSGSSGARIACVKYLDTDYKEQTEFVSLRGVTSVAMTGSALRINEFYITSAGSSNATSGSVKLFANTTGSVVYGYISPAMTRARSSVYTVPAGKALFVTNVTFSWAYAGHDNYTRMYTRANQMEGVRTGSIFYPYTECVCANSSQSVDLDVPTKLAEKVDIRVSGIATVAGTATAVLRGWLETVS